jgi:hypothetical protein
MTDIFQGQLDSQVVRNYDRGIPPIAKWVFDAGGTEVTFHRTDEGKVEEMDIWVKHTIGTTGKYCYTGYVFDNIEQTLRELTYEKMLELGFGKRLKNLKLENPRKYNQKLKGYIEHRKRPKGFKDLIVKALAKIATKTTINDPYIRQRIFYDASGAESHREFFGSDKNDPKSVSLLVRNNVRIGNRFYSTDDRAYFSTLPSGTESTPRHAVLRGPGMDHRLSVRAIVHTIYREHNKNKPGYAIDGSYPKTPAIMATIAQRNSNPNCVVIPITKKNEELWGPELTEQELLEAIGIDALPPLSPKVVMFPVIAKGHETVLFVDREDEDDNVMWLADSSLGHTENVNQEVVPRPSVFGNLSGDIGMLSTAQVQTNGTCSFWANSLAEVISNDSVEYQDMATIQAAFRNGSLWLEAAAIMSKIFDAPNSETVRVFETEKAAKNHNKHYVYFETGGKYYGIRRHCCTNKFVNIGKLIETLPKETKRAIGVQLNGQIEIQNLIIPFEDSFSACDEINQKHVDILNELIQRGRGMRGRGMRGRKFDLFFDSLLRKKEECKGQQLLFQGIGEIIKTDKDLTSEDPVIRNIKTRYDGLRRNFERLIASIGRNPSLTSDNLKQNEDYIALSNNNTREKSGKIPEPSYLIDSFCKDLKKAMDELENEIALEEEKKRKREEEAKQKAAKQKAARQKAARQKAAEQEAAEQEAVEQEVERQKAARRRAARRRAKEKFSDAVPPYHTDAVNKSKSGIRSRLETLRGATDEFESKTAMKKKEKGQGK